VLLELDGIVGILLLALWIYCIFDVIASDAALVRNLPKTGWLFIVFILPDIGAIAWLLLGRPERAGWRPGDTTMRAPGWTPKWGSADDRTLDPDTVTDRDRLIAQWDAEEAARKQARREQVDAETQARKRAAEERLIEARRRDREAEKLKHMALELPVDDEPKDPTAN
jgi:hypothetical protein